MHTLAISEQETSLHAEGDTLLLYRQASVLRRVRVAEIDQLLLFGRIELTSGAILLLLRRGVDVVWLTTHGEFRGRLVGRSSKNVPLRLAQYRRTQQADFCARVAAALVGGKIHQQRQLLLRAQRRLQDADLAVALGQLRTLGQRARTCPSIDTLRGLEGQAAAVYFGQLGKLLRNEELRFQGRTRRPPRDEVNAMLSFGYAVLGTTLETEMYRCGLDPLLGFFHQSAYGRPSLMLDLLEEFRPTIDALVVRLVNRRQVGPGDFARRTGKELAELLNEEASPPTAPTPAPQPGVAAPWEDALAATGAGQPPPAPVDPPAPPKALGGDVPVPPEAHVAGDPAAQGTAVPSNAQAPSPATDPPATGVVGVYLADVGRKIFLNELFHRLRERLYYPPRNVTLEMREIIRQQIYHLARVIEGSDPQYQPFVTD